MNIEIKSAKLVKEQTLEITFAKTEKDKTTTSVKETHKSKAHPDLVDAYAALKAHLGILTGYISPKLIKDITNTQDVDLVDQFKVSSFSLGGDEGAEGFVITGHRILPNKKAVILNSPFTKFEEKEETRYPFMEDLEEKLETIQKELALYLGGKFAPEPQQELFNPGENNLNGEKVTKAKIAAPAAPGEDGVKKPLFKDEGTTVTQEQVDREMIQKGGELAAEAKKKNARGKR